MLRPLFFTAIGLFLCLLLTAQPKRKLERASELYENYSYVAAMALYEEVLFGPDGAKMDLDDRRRLANCYRLTNRAEKAEPLYAELVADPQGNFSLYYEYAEILFSNGKFEEAKKWFVEFARLRPADPRGMSMATMCDTVRLIRPVYPGAIVKLTGASSPDSDDFGPAFFGANKIVFTSDRIGIGKAKTEWTGRSYLDMYTAEIEENGSLEKVDFFDRGINTPLKHEGPACFSDNGMIVFFTRNSVNADVSNTINLQLFRAERSGNGWKREEPLPFNSEAYNCMHPSCSPDGKTLYFASNRPGGYGGVDIWVSFFEYGKWTKPKNLGPEVNTRGDEAFPFIFAEDRLYFASKNGHPGFGGFDLFLAESNGETWRKPVNLGRPLNCERDDTGLVLNAEGDQGYFASSREAREQRNDDIYHVYFLVLSLRGKVTDAKTGAPLDQVTVTMSEDRFQWPTDKSGNFRLNLEPNRSYTFRVEKPGYEEGTFTVSTQNVMKSSVFERNIALEPLAVAVVEPTKTAEPKPEQQPEPKVEPKPEPLPVAKPVLDIALKVELTVVDKQTGKPLPQATFVLLNKTIGQTESALADSSGQVRYQLIRNNWFDVTAGTPGYISSSLPFNTFNVEGEHTISAKIPLERIEVGKVIKVENIYYNLDDYRIRSDAALELDKLNRLLVENPTMTIELRSHTDARGSDEYNMRLSQNRARAAVEYLISRGIAEIRLTAKGYGESTLVNGCANGVRCPEEQHQENRRTEFKVLGF